MYIKGGMKMNKGLKKSLSLLIAVLMLVSALPVTVFAANVTCNVFGHKLDWVETRAATCSVEGEEVRKCTRNRCDYTTGETKVLALKSHTVVTISAVEPTCEKDGNTQGSYCSVCGLDIVVSKKLNALGHNIVDFEAKAPTCTQNGYTAGKKCSICNMITFGGESLPTIPHKVTNALSWVTKIPATCVKEGLKAAPCSGCGMEITEVIPKTAHTYVEWTVKKAATCFESGVAETYCRICNEKQTQTIDRLPHSEVVTEFKAATCTQSGNTRGVICSNCKTEIEKLVVIAPLGHDYIKDESKSEEPDCINEGYFYGKCSRCDDLRDEVLPALGHTEVIYALGEVATCVKEGKTDGIACEVCREIIKEQTTIPAVSHDYQGTWQTIIAPTCTSSGISIKTCKNCYDAQSVRLPEIGHSDANGDDKCDVCGYVDEENCTCKCHRKGMLKWFFKFKLLFQRIFKLNKSCDCGAVHY